MLITRQNGKNLADFSGAEYRYDWNLKLRISDIFFNNFLFVNSHQISDAAIYLLMLAEFGSHHKLTVQQCLNTASIFLIRCRASVGES